MTKAEKKAAAAAKTAKTNTIEMTPTVDETTETPAPAETTETPAPVAEIPAPAETTETPTPVAEIPAPAETTETSTPVAETVKENTISNNVITFPATPAQPTPLKIKGAVKNPPKPSGNGAGSRGPRVAKSTPTLNILHCSYAHWTKFASKIANGSLVWDATEKTFVQIEIEPIAAHIRFGLETSPLYNPSAKKYDGVVVCSANNIEKLLENISNFYAQTPEMLNGMDLSKTNWKNPFTEIEGDEYMPTITVKIASPIVKAAVIEAAVAEVDEA